MAFIRILILLRIPCAAQRLHITSYPGVRAKANTAAQVYIINILFIRQKPINF